MIERDIGQIEQIAVQNPEEKRLMRRVDVLIFQFFKKAHPEWTSSRQKVAGLTNNFWMCFPGGPNRKGGFHYKQEPGYDEFEERIEEVIRELHLESVCRDIVEKNGELNDQNWVSVAEIFLKMIDSSYSIPYLRR